MGLGNLFKTGPSSFQTNVAADQAAVAQQTLANQQAATSSTSALNAQAGAATAAAQAAAKAITNPVQKNQVALGVLDYIRTSSQGLSNTGLNSGRLSILGN